MHVDFLLEPRVVMTNTLWIDGVLYLVLKIASPESDDGILRAGAVPHCEAASNKGQLAYGQCQFLGRCLPIVPSP
jgi:hypothetical protein